MSAMKTAMIVMLTKCVFKIMEHLGLETTEEYLNLKRFFTGWKNDTY